MMPRGFGGNREPSWSKLTYRDTWLPMLTRMDWWFAFRRRWQDAGLCLQKEPRC